MLVFAVYAINGGCQYAQFTIIKDVIIKYYGVSSVQVEWTTNIYMLAYAVLIIPSLYLWDKVVSSLHNAPTEMNNLSIIKKIVSSLIFSSHKSYFLL